MSENVQEGKYHRVAPWRIALFSLNNTATNLYLFAYGYLAYYLVNEESWNLIPVSMAAFSALMGAARLFDGLIDPTIGILMDRIDTKWGRFRPIMLLSNIGLILSFIFMFSLHLVPNATMKMALFVVALIFHKIVYSFQQTVTKAAQATLTNDPEQRPLFSIFDNIFSSILIFTLGDVFVSNIMIPKFKTFSLPFFQAFIPGVMIFSAVCTILAIIGIAPKDKPQYYANLQVEDGQEMENKGLGYIWEIVKGNRPLKLLAVAAGFMKLAVQLMSDKMLIVLIFGIVLGNYALLGQMGIISAVVSFFAITVMSRISGKKGLKWGYQTGIILSLIGFAGMGIVMTIPETPADIFGNGWGGLAIAFVASYIMAKVFSNYPVSLSLTMSADITDYEKARSGRFVSGLIGTVFSLTDSIASALAPIFSGWIMAAIGYGASAPQPNDPLNRVSFLGALFGYVILPALLLIFSYILVRFYPLDKKAMEDVAEKLAIEEETHHLVEN